MSTSIDILGILKHLPHRYPMLMVDRVLELIPGERIETLKNVSINEPYFQGHFPDYPVMPGVMILEALAQTSALLAFRSAGVSSDESAVVLFVGIDSARFKRVVTAGDQLKMVATPIRNRGGIWKFDAKAYVDEQLVCEAELMCTYRQRENKAEAGH
jgi:3-hydroxyacyl-[acyl-carrier-protein] dehydratase